MKANTPAVTRTLARRDLLIGTTCFAGAALGSSAVIWRAPVTAPPSALEALIPTQIGNWKLASTHGIVLTEDGDSRRPYDDILTRIYQSTTSGPVTLVVAYVGSPRGDVRLHRPEACYPAAGFILSDRELTTLEFEGLPAVSARTMLAQSATGTERLLYWTRVGREFPTSGGSQIAAYVRANLMGIRPDAVLVRLSVPGNNKTASQIAFRAFLTALIEGSTPAAVSLLFGRSLGVRHGPQPRGLENGSST